MGMTREEAIEFIAQSVKSDVDMALVADAIKALEQEPTTKNDLGVDCINRAELLKAMDTWDKFGYTETGCFVREPKGDYVPYVHYEDMVNCVKGMPSVTQEPIFDKLRAEIEKLQKMCDKNDLNLMAQYSAFGMVLDILDKYKAESEGDNGNDD